MRIMAVTYEKSLIQSLNKDINEVYPHLFPIEEGMTTAHEGVSRLVMLDRYAQKDIQLVTLKEGDLVLVVVKDDPKFPARGIGRVVELNVEEEFARILVDEEFRASLTE